MPEICRLFTSYIASGTAIKILIGIREDDDSVSTYQVAAQVAGSLTEAQINNALGSWLTSNGYSNLVGKVGVHVNRDGSYCLWTGSEPPEWPEDGEIT